MSLTATIPSTSPFDDFFEVDMKQVKEYGYFKWVVPAHQDGPIQVHFNRGKVEKQDDKARRYVGKSQIDTYWMNTATQFSFDEQQLEEYGQTI